MREGEYLAFEKDEATASLQLTGVDGFADDQPMDLTDDALFDEEAEIITSGELARFGADKRGDQKIQFRRCGATARPTGFLSSDHPYKPGTACQWFIKGPPGAKVWIKLLKMDIEEERPSDSSVCGSPFNKDHLPCKPGQNRLCEWDYLRIQVHLTDRNYRGSRIRVHQKLFSPRTS